MVCSVRSVWTLGDVIALSGSNPLKIIALITVNLGLPGVTRMSVCG